MLKNGISGLEIEFKYRADKIEPWQFKAFCKKKMKNSKYSLISGWDRFYGHPGKPDSFFRHRKSSDGLNQLTFKRKLNDDNSFIRVEHNVDLQDSISVHQVGELCRELGYKYNMSLYKIAHIFQAHKYTLVYYKCGGKCLLTGTEFNNNYFIEIEMSETYPWKDQAEAYKELIKLEKKFKGLGLSSRKRVKKSLWELYKK